MHHSTYHYLTIFHAIASEGSIAGAARKLQLASPSVSQSLKLLEQQLGLPLFHRTTRRVELTEAGERLLHSTKNALAELDFAFESVHDLTNEPSGSVRITVSNIAYLLILQPHFAEFCRLYPQIQLEISVSDGIVDILQDGFDLGIRFGFNVQENMVAKQLCQPFKSGLYVSQAYADEHGIPKKINDLLGHKLIAFRFTTANKLFPLKLQEKGQEMELEMPSALITNNMNVVMDAVRAGVGIGRIFEPLIAKQVDKTAFIPVLEKHWITFPPLYLYFMQHSQKAKRVRVLIEFLLEKTKMNN